jgi:hypothetical protein
VFWIIDFWGMVALGVACENMAMAVGAPWMGMWLIFWAITNVSTSFYDIDIEPWFYYWGYTWPLHQSKSMIVNVRNTSIMHISLKSWTN